MKDLLDKYLFQPFRLEVKNTRITSTNDTEGREGAAKASVAKEQLEFIDECLNSS